MKIILTVTLEVDKYNYFDHGNESDINSDNVTDIDKVSHNDSNFDSDN